MFLSCPVDVDLALWKSCAGSLSLLKPSESFLEHVTSPALALVYCVRAPWKGKGKLLECRAIEKRARCQREFYFLPVQFVSGNCILEKLRQPSVRYRQAFLIKLATHALRSNREMEDGLILIGKVGRLLNGRYDPFSLHSLKTDPFRRSCVQVPEFWAKILDVLFGNIRWT